MVLFFGRSWDVSPSPWSERLPEVDCLLRLLIAIRVCFHCAGSMLINVPLLDWTSLPLLVSSVCPAAYSLAFADYNAPNSSCRRTWRISTGGTGCEKHGLCENPTEVLTGWSLWFESIVMLHGIGCPYKGEVIRQKTRTYCIPLAVSIVQR